MRLDPVERRDELVAVVDARAQHDLRMDLDATREQTLEHLDAARGTRADQRASNLGRDRVDGDVHRREAAGDDALGLLVGDVGERHEVALEEGEAVVVVAQGEGGAGLGGQHGHEAELAGVHAGAHAVEEHVGEVDAPVLAGLSPELAGGGGVVARVKDLELAGGSVRLPAPVDEVTRLDAVHADDAHAGLDARLPGWAALLDPGDPGASRPRPRRGVVGARLIGHVATPRSSRPDAAGRSPRSPTIPNMRFPT